MRCIIALVVTVITVNINTASIIKQPTQSMKPSVTKLHAEIEFPEVEYPEDIIGLTKPHYFSPYFKESNILRSFSDDVKTTFKELTAPEQIKKPDLITESEKLQIGKRNSLVPVAITKQLCDSTIFKDYLEDSSDLAAVLTDQENNGITLKNCSLQSVQLNKDILVSEINTANKNRTENNAEIVKDFFEDSINLPAVYTDQENGEITLIKSKLETVPLSKAISNNDSEINTISKNNVIKEEHVFENYFNNTGLQNKIQLENINFLQKLSKEVIDETFPMNQDETFLRTGNEALTNITENWDKFVGKLYDILAHKPDED